MPKTTKVGRPLSPTPMVVKSFTVDPVEFERFQNYAKARGISMSYIIRASIAAWMKQQGAK